jgi:hypothetical protein
MAARIDALSHAPDPRNAGRPNVAAYLDGLPVTEARRLDLQDALRNPGADIGPRCLNGRPYVSIYWIEDEQPGPDGTDIVRMRSRAVELKER